MSANNPIFKNDDMSKKEMEVLNKYFPKSMQVMKRIVEESKWER